MKKFHLLITHALFLCLFSIAQADVATVRYRHVDNKDMEEYLKREITYWKPISQQAIADGPMKFWSVWQRVGGFDSDEGPNIMIYASFDDDHALDTSGGMGEAIEKVFPNKDFSEITVSHLFTPKAFLLQRPLYSTVEEGISPELPKVIRVNYAKSPDNASLNNYIELETEVWAPFISSLIGTGQTSVTSWHFGVVINPMGSDNPFDAVSVDGFDSIGPRP